MKKELKLPELNGWGAKTLTFHKIDSGGCDSGPCLTLRRDGGTLAGFGIDKKTLNNIMDFLIEISVEVE